MKKPVIFFCLIAVGIGIALLWWAKPIHLIPNVASAQNRVEQAIPSPVQIVNEAQLLAKQGRFDEAIKKIDQIKPVNTDEAKTIAEIRRRWLREKGSEQGEAQLTKALSLYRQGDIQAAIDAAENLPEGSSAKQEYAQKLRKQWFRNAALLGLTQQFHEEGRCTTALFTISQIRDRALLESNKVKSLRSEIMQMQGAQPANPVRETL